MRRLLSILLLLGIAIAPALASIPAHPLASGWTGQVDEASIPACCRRAGKHHCNMGVSRASSEATVSPAGCCPCMPQAAASLLTDSSAVLPVSAALAMMSAQAPVMPQRHDAAVTLKQRTQPLRGPPAFQLL